MARTATAPRAYKVIVQQEAEGFRAEHSVGIAGVSFRHRRQFIILGGGPFM